MKLHKKNILIRSSMHSPSNFDSKPSTQIPRQRSVNQFEEADPISKDRKIIKMRNVVDLGDATESVHKSSSKQRRRQSKDEQDQLLEQLDQWHEQVISKKKAFAFEQVKQNDNKFMENEFSSEGGPQINQTIINSILKPQDKQQLKNLSLEDEQNSNVQVKFQQLRSHKDSNPVLKTLDQVRIEMNKHILNSLLLQKVTKKLDDLQISRKGKSNWNHQKMDEETTQVVRDQSQALKNSTLNNFKGLTEYFSNPSQYIDYDIVLSKAKYYSNRPPNQFSVEIVQTGQQTSQTAKQLMESFSQFQIQIKENKQVLYQMRLDNNRLVQKATAKEDEISEIRRKYYGKEEKARLGYVSEQEGKKRNMMEILEKIRQQRDVEIRNIQKFISQIKDEMHRNTEKQEIIQKDLDELRQKKRRCKMLLKDIFLKQLQEANESLMPEGLVQIIKQMKKINENAKVEQFPRYLDDQSRQYLLQAAQLEIQIEDTRSQSQKQNHNITNLKSTQSQQCLFQTQPVSVSQLKSQVKTMLKRSGVSIKKPVFVQGIDPMNPSSFAHVIKWENQELESIKLQDSEETHFKLQNMPSEGNLNFKDFNQKLVQFQQQLEQLQKEEQKRVLKLYQNKRHLSDVQELKLVLYSLFGQVIGDQVWYEFVIEWTEQKSLNPQSILMKDSELKANDKGQSQKQINEKIKQRIANTYRKLQQSNEIEYNFNMLD
ncbi:unnamed protein product (macronuclear) [Paramecium tetraurelia]|uniref:Uncharacterized protein n=1 Tax=Paramecium tetraurelia TaxID=5888 RepID=A0DHT5_PARTE|nr:uncharacterized protein GSPATT00016989001 [Paramecium tetraurelia]CAK82602.1 unnamed protein product [Paramecium tetraurelia]|eukprot:XP_001449999.1 hypothetical protein (macronuclear) [Paramecium tetraurelia strain d4-2]